jgi:tetratricopeptide (TPR) repeat protein
MPSEWERIRKEIRLEKPQAEEAAKPPREPSLSDVILKMLADNGRHFTQLGENETLTVAVTFRAPENGSVVAPGAAMLDFDNDGRMDLFIVNTVDQGTLRSPHLVQDDKPRNKPTTEDSTQKKVRDLVLLGELHLKQSKPDDAIKTLRQALELKPEGEQASTISRLLAQALVNTQKYDEAVQLLQKLADERKNKQTNAPPKTEASGAPQAAPLPSKLIISASKKLLDQVAAGQMSFEEFKKAASVEYLTFPTEKK